MKTIRASIKGYSPLIVHSCAGANPTNVITKEKKRLTSKRGRTDETNEAIEKLSWLSGLYTSEPGTFEIINDLEVRISGYGQPVVPGHNIEACLVQAARRSKKGKNFECGLFITGDVLINYGEKKLSVAEMSESPLFVDTQMGVINRSRVPITRPIFRNWALTFDIEYDSEILDHDEIFNTLETAGRLIGLCDQRPKYGRFIVTQFDKLS